MSENEKTTNNLLHLGSGVGSKVEQIKLESKHLRGQLAEELAEDTTHFTETQVHLLKFSGIYQQEDRDARQTRPALATTTGPMLLTTFLPSSTRRN